VSPKTSSQTTDKNSTCLGTSSWKKQGGLQTSVFPHTSATDWTVMVIMVLPAFNVNFIKILIHGVAQKFCTGCKTAYSLTFKLSLLNTI